MKKSEFHYLETTLAPLAEQIRKDVGKMFPHMIDLDLTSPYRAMSPLTRASHAFANKKLHADIHQWLRDEIRGEWFQRGSHISFKSQDDAMLFKLRWC